MSTQKKEEILHVARKLFANGNYKEVTLTNIANQLGIKPASLYYYFPTGKEQLYLQALECELIKYKRCLQSLLKTCVDLKSFLLAFSAWYQKQPQMNMEVIYQIDMPLLSKRGTEQLKHTIYDCVFGPLGMGIEHFGQQLKQEINPRRLTGVYFSLLGSAKMAIDAGFDSYEMGMQESVLMLLNGVLI